jgi:hypothetical protein
VASRDDGGPAEQREKRNVALARFGAVAAAFQKYRKWLWFRQRKIKKSKCPFLSFKISFGIWMLQIHPPELCFFRVK